MSRYQGGRVIALAHAILAFLVDCPRSGYELAKNFDGSVGFFWKATHQQIYRELAKLEADGWIQSEAIAQTGRPDKKLFRVTELGQQQLMQWMAEPCEPAAIKEDLLVKLFAGHLVPQSMMVQELERHRMLHQERLATYKTIQQQFFPSPEVLSIAQKFQYLTLLKGIGYETEYIAWCEQAIALLS
ncbi:MAG: PadR family transcriptional regulator [Leptolyngbyaceae bacterium]|nr:PadR family transcriptional regulator [Leptolyngbyaceae bacterium]